MARKKSVKKVVVESHDECVARKRRESSANEVLKAARLKELNYVEPPFRAPKVIQPAAPKRKFVPEPVDSFRKSRFFTDTPKVDLVVEEVA